jgi:sugar-specific transcriptional regulator TrmB
MADADGRTDAEIRDELAVFGLSTTEIDTYLALLSHGEATTRAVAADADVTQRAVYDIAERLEDRGLVRVKEHASPTRIRALPPQEAIGNLSARLDALTPALADRFNDPPSKAPEIRMVKSRETALKRIRSAIAGAEREAIVAVPRDVYPAIESDLRAAADRDALVFLLLGQETSATARTGPAADASPGTDVSTEGASGDGGGNPTPIAGGPFGSGSEWGAGGDATDGTAGADGPEGPAAAFAGRADVVRSWAAALPFLYAVDDEAAMIGDPDLLSGTASDEEAVTVSQRHLTGAVHGIFLSAYWPASREVYVTDPDPLPKSFDWFRAAVLHAYLHRRRGTDLRASVQTKADGVIHGTVEEVRQAFVGPPTNDYALETSLVLRTDGAEAVDGTAPAVASGNLVSVGGPGAFIEDVQAETIILRADA